MSTSTLSEFTPGSLIHARGREWVVQPGSNEVGLKLRPLGGSDEDLTFILPELELDPPRAATFPPPDPALRGNHTSALLLSDALKLKLRSGAGPFRSFSNIAVEPRAYQLVPLLMALRLPTVRLLIADDVGIGKTIEAGLIARELYDRGEITKFAVLCPPHLVDQWQSELEKHFHFKAVTLTSSSARRVEKGLPPGVSLFDQHPFVVVSLDYIKSDTHRAHFLNIAPECIIVDEAHACSTHGKGKQLRFELLQQLAEDDERHMLFLSATPHSGNDEAFHNLLSLLKQEFIQLKDGSQSIRGKLREELAKHFVQRRRKDIEEWQDLSVFPRRMTTEITYNLSGDWGNFFDDVQAYCLEIAERAEARDHSIKHMIWYATLALLRCVASSPAAAEKALSTRLTGTLEEMEALADESRIKDAEGDDLSSSDLEPAGAIEETESLHELIATAKRLQGMVGDPKLTALMSHLEELVKDGFRPVVFCRYVATAHYVAEHVRKHFKKATVVAITGEFTPEERELRVRQLGDEDQPILIATDCLSEGINLQEEFNSVVHYDLAWNPTRHEQREGRVDRFGQKSPEVRCTMLWGQDNPVDGFILNVIVRKARDIQKELGVLVPLPQDEKRINQAMIKAALLKRNNQAGSNKQMELSLEEAIEEALNPLKSEWEDAYKKAKANRTVFAQRRLTPEDVLPEWDKQLKLIGDAHSIERFVKNACARLNAPLEKSKKSWRFLPQHLPQTLRERLAEEGIAKELRIDFHYPPNSQTHFIHRTHPLVAILADSLLETALQEASPIASRCAATVTDAVQVITRVYLLRLRHQLTYRRYKKPRTLMAEETAAIALEGQLSPRWLDPSEVNRLLEVVPTGNLKDGPAQDAISKALEYLEANTKRLEALATERADALLQDHLRIRHAARDIGEFEVSPCLPVDVIGTYVLLPDSL